MPYVHIKTTEPIDPETEVKLFEACPKIINESFGIEEKWVMPSCSGNAHLMFNGSTDHVAHINVRTMAEQTPENALKATKAFCDLVNQKLGIPKENIYINYEVTAYWGWNDINF